MVRYLLMVKRWEAAFARDTVFLGEWHGVIVAFLRPALKTFLANMEYPADDRAHDEGGEGGAEHEADRFAELAPECAVKNDRAIEGECREEHDADRGRDRERSDHGRDQKVGECEQNDRAKI